MRIVSVTDARILRLAFRVAVVVAVLSAAWTWGRMHFAYVEARDKHSAMVGVLVCGQRFSDHQLNEHKNAFGNIDLGLPPEARPWPS